MQENLCLCRWELKACMMTTREMLYYMIRDMSGNELENFLVWNSSVLNANQGSDGFVMNESCLMCGKARAHAVWANTREKMSVSSLIYLLTAIYYGISLLSVMSCDAGCLPAKRRRRQGRNHWLKARNEAIYNIQCTHWRNNCAEACGMVHADVQETQGNIWVQIKNPRHHLNQRR